jgi:hypothetical protein
LGPKSPENNNFEVDACDFAPSAIMYFSRAMVVESARGWYSSCQGTERYACLSEKGKNYLGNRDAKWYAIGLERESEYCIFCDKACGIDAVGKVRVFLKSE